jgi:leader peptidase (prepilin peptidase)/N-methyltransferase
VIFAAAFGAASASLLPGLACRLAEPSAAGDTGRGSPARTVLTGAATATLLATTIGPSPRLPVYLLAAVPGLLLALIDLRCLRLPDRIVAALAVIAGVPLAVLFPQRIGTALAAAVLVLVTYGIVALLPRRPLGLGDVKLAAVLALILGFAGWPQVLAGVLAAHLINGPIALFLLVSGRTARGGAIPFGPALLAGALLAVTTA